MQQLLLLDRQLAECRRAQGLQADLEDQAVPALSDFELTPVHILFH